MGASGRGRKKDGVPNLATATPQMFTVLCPLWTYKMGRY